MKHLEKLDPCTRTKLRSTQILTSLPQIISELVQNSLDAYATSIEVGVDFNDWMCWVKDNGLGITIDGLHFLAGGSEAGRYGTSKSNPFQEFISTEKFGFRGEALASAADLSCLEISSRTVHSRETWSIIMKGTKNLYVGPAVRWRRESSGTVVCLRDTFYNFPIRRRSHPAPSRSFDIIRQCLESYALVFPNVSFSLENIHQSKSNNYDQKKRITRILKATSTVMAFRNLYGRGLTEHVEEIEVMTDNLKLSGFISLVGSHSKEYQFLYVNRHPLSRCHLHRVIDAAFASSSFAQNALDECGKMSLPRLALKCSHRNPKKLQVYVLNLTIPSASLDNCLDPAKMEVLFQDRNAVESLLTSCINSFLIRHGFESSNPRILSPSIQNSPSECRGSIFEDDFQQFEITSTEQKEQFHRKQISNPPLMIEQLHVPGYDRRTIPPQAVNICGEEVASISGDAPMWLRQVLKENQVNSLAERSIPFIKQIPITAKISASRIRRASTISNCRHIDVKGVQNSPLQRLRKEDLRNARVINQVDKKFVACIIQQSIPDSQFDKNQLGSTLFLIDQHAADERVRVERFLRELCLGFLYGHEERERQASVSIRNIVPPMPVLLTICEARILGKSETMRQILRRWGFIFELSPTESSALDPRNNVGYVQIMVLGIPSIVAEKLLLGDELCNVIKGFVVQLETELPPTSLFDVSWETDNTFRWIKALRWCPQGLLDLINSKACRGAIMFNDTLSIVQCQTLVQELSETAFPFQCAHGRPSIIPMASIL